MGREKSQSCAYRIEIKKDYSDMPKEELLDEVVDLFIENEKLKRKLRKYENPHTPPSKDEREAKTKFISITGLSVGKQTGYKGRTRKKKKTTHFINLFQGICSDCGKHNKQKEIRKKPMKKLRSHNQLRLLKQNGATTNVNVGIICSQIKTTF